MAMPKKLITRPVSKQARKQAKREARFEAAERSARAEMRKRPPLRSGLGILTDASPARPVDAAARRILAGGDISRKS